MHHRKARRDLKTPAKAFRRLMLATLLSACCSISHAADNTPLSPGPRSRIKVSWTLFGEAPMVGKLGCSITHLDQGWAWVHDTDHFNTIVDQVNGFNGITYGVGMMVHF